LHFRDDASGTLGSENPFYFISWAAFRRDLARALGDDADAARWQRIVDAHARVLADRDKVIALRLFSMR
jgi:hypothetical protein